MHPSQSKIPQKAEYRIQEAEGKQNTEYRIQESEWDKAESQFSVFSFEFSEGS